MLEKGKCRASWIRRATPALLQQKRPILYTPTHSTQRAAGAHQATSQQPKRPITSQQNNLPSTSLLLISRLVKTNSQAQLIMIIVEKIPAVLQQAAHAAARPYHWTTTGPQPPKSLSAGWNIPSTPTAATWTTPPQQLPLICWRWPGAFRHSADPLEELIHGHHGGAPQHRVDGPRQHPPEEPPGPLALQHLPQKD